MGEDWDFTSTSFQIARDYYYDEFYDRYNTNQRQNREFKRNAKRERKRVACVETEVAQTLAEGMVGATTNQHCGLDALDHMVGRVPLQAI